LYENEYATSDMISPHSTSLMVFCKTDIFENACEKFALAIYMQQQLFVIFVNLLKVEFSFCCRKT